MEWSKPFGKRKQQTLRVPLEIMGIPLSRTAWMTSQVGFIKQKNDGRWDYFLATNDTSFGAVHPRIVASEVSQGVCLTEQEAKAKVEANYKQRK